MPVVRAISQIKQGAARMMPETELKLELTPDNADAFLACDPFAGGIPAAAARPSTSTRQKRPCGGGFHAPGSGEAGETARAYPDGEGRGPAAGMFLRQEWGWSVPDDRLRSSMALPFVSMLGAVQDIRPVFRSPCRTHGLRASFRMTRHSRSRWIAARSWQGPPFLAVRDQAQA